MLQVIMCSPTARAKVHADEQSTLDDEFCMSWCCIRTQTHKPCILAPPGKVFDLLQ